MAVRDPMEPPAPRDQLALSSRFEAAERLLGHGFARPELLDEALTHRSATQSKQRGRKAANSNERLEFMGDRVLGLLVAEWLIERFPEEPEGALGPRLAHLVSRRVLVEIAERAGLSQALTIGENEARAGVGSLANVLADAMEAAIGALYLDGGLDAARRFVRAAWAAEIEGMSEPPKDPKTELQEWLMARGLPLPVYEVTACSGPSHRPEFVMQVTGGGRAGTGVAGSKRVAERDAAADLLAQLQA